MLDIAILFPHGHTSWLLEGLQMSVVDALAITSPLLRSSTWLKHGIIPRWKKSVSTPLGIEISPKMRARSAN
jgi:hypothetical protein